MTELQAVIEQERCRRSAHYFIFDSKLVRTTDEHDFDNPIKPFPDLLYLRILLDWLLVSGRLIKPEDTKYAQSNTDLQWLARLYSTRTLLMEKSRQMMLTWLVGAYVLWRARSYPSQLLLVQSKREEDALKLVYNGNFFDSRISSMEARLPEILQRIDSVRCGHILFKGTNSHIWAIPEGGDIIRSNTASVIVADEAAYQPEFGESYTAAMPSVRGGGQYIAFSSAEPGEFQQLVEAQT